jgi:hypothetical protein
LHSILLLDNADSDKSIILFFGKTQAAAWY